MNPVYAWCNSSRKPKPASIPVRPVPARPALLRKGSLIAYLQHALSGPSPMLATPLQFLWPQNVIKFALITWRKTSYVGPTSSSRTTTTTSTPAPHCTAP